MVVGGGLAGITAALALADAGVRVTLLEGRPRLGGLAFSFRRAASLTVDNGQHVYLRCCTAYRWFLDRVDGAALAPLQDRLDVPVLDVGAARGPRLGTAAPQRAARTAAPGREPRHATRTSRSPSAPRSARAALALEALDPADPALDAQDFAHLAAPARPVGARRRGAVGPGRASPPSTPCAGDASLGLAAMVFKTGLLSEPGRRRHRLGRVPLGELHDTLARKALDSAGVRTELRTRVTLRLPPRERAAGAFEVRRREPLRTADTVVLAVPQREAHALLPEGALDDPDRLLDIGTAPILNIHVVYDRKVLRRPSSPRSAPPCSGSSTGPRPPGSRRAASTWRCPSRPRTTRSTLPVAELRERYLPELERLLPAARAAPRCGTSSSPGSAPRPSPPPPASGGCGPAPAPRRPACAWPERGPPPGWPATMESAVRSGVSAAGAALTALGRPHDHLLDLEEAA